MATKKILRKRVYSCYTISDKEHVIFSAFQCWIYKIKDIRQSFSLCCSSDKIKYMSIHFIQMNKIDRLYKMCTVLNT